MENYYGSILTNYYIHIKASSFITALPPQTQILNCFSNDHLLNKPAIARKAFPLYELTDLNERGHRQIKISKSRVKLRASFVKQPLLC